MTECIELLKYAISCIKEEEIRKASERVDNAVRNFHRADYHCRVNSINAINVNIRKIKILKHDLMGILEELPEEERQYARIHIESVVDSIYTDELVMLRKRKRELSKPSRLH